MTEERNARLKTGAEPPKLQTGPVREAERPLSPARAFVVQFREQTEGAAPRFTGRVEHMISGHAARFESSEELLQFFVRVLSTGRTKRSPEG